jgi:hypothetical protein
VLLSDAGLWTGMLEVNRPEERTVTRLRRRDYFVDNVSSTFCTLSHLDSVWTL